ncbi:MAG: DNA-binding protein WhiA [Chloroflexota bacterium]
MSDLATTLRAELAAIDPARRCCRAAERAALGAAATGRARTPLLGRLAVRLDDAAGEAAFDWATAAEHDRICWLRGALLAHGSISVTPTGTHLEVVVAPRAAGLVGEWLLERGDAAGVRLRRGRGVLTWKSSEGIVALLRRVGASAVPLEIEQRVIGRSVAGQLNRVVNAENANLRRAVAAARRQLTDIDSLERRNVLRRLPRAARRVAVARRRSPEATFSQLAADLELSRGQVQRAFGVIESVALHEGAE